MSVYFSEKFKQLRKNKDLTQEQIADIFYVSPQSVSRWETGVNYPDIETLPHIAIFFKVTLDELLGTEEIRGEEKVKEYIRDIRNLLNSGKINDAIDKTRKAIKEYPLSRDLQYHLLQALSNSCFVESPDFEKIKAEIITVGEKIINNNPADWGIKVQLIRQYTQWNMKEKAKKILNTLPAEAWDTQEPWTGLLLDGEEWQKDTQLRIIRFTILLCYFIGNYSNRADLDILQKIECRKAIMQIESLTSPMSGNNIDSVDSAFSNISIAGLYCEANDKENALDYVEKATRDSMNHIEQMDKTNNDGSNYMAWSTPRNLPWILWEDNLIKPWFDFIRTEERFIKCLDLLKANSRELK